MQCCCNEDIKQESMYSNVFNDFGPVDEVLKKYIGKPGSLIAILQEIQGIYGYLAQNVLKYVAGEIGEKPAKVIGTATFYTQFRFKPVGKYHIQLCQGTACHVNGSEKIENAIYEELKIKDGETTEDDLFTIKNVACLGCCSLSPVMMINGETYGKLTPDKAKKIIKDIKARDNESMGV